MSWNAMLLAMAVVSADPQLGEDDVFLEISEADLTSIRGVIRDQLAAFRAGNAERAFATASDDLQEAFSSADRFLAAVLSEAEPLARPRMVFFGELMLTPDGLAQAVELVDHEGDRHTALYLVERSKRGGWRVGGCLVGAVPDGPVDAIAA